MNKSNPEQKAPKKVIEFVKNMEDNMSFKICDIQMFMYNAGIGTYSDSTIGIALKYCCENGILTKLGRRIYQKLPEKKAAISTDDGRIEHTVLSRLTSIESMLARLCKELGVN